MVQMCKSQVTGIRSDLNRQKLYEEWAWFQYTKASFPLISKLKHRVMKIPSEMCQEQVGVPEHIVVILNVVHCEQAVDLR